MDRSNRTGEPSPLRIGMVRAVVPMLGVNFSDFPEWSRRLVGPNMVLASLDQSEAARVNAQALRPNHNYGACRIELYEMLDDFDEVGQFKDPAQFYSDERWEQRKRYLAAQSGAAERLTQLVTLLCLVVRLPTNQAGIVADCWTGFHWARLGSVPVRNRPRGDDDFAYFPLSRIATWERLLAAWPKVVSKSLGLALDYYVDSLVERRLGALNKALLSAVTAMEVLLAPDNAPDLKRRVSTRGAHLVSDGTRGIEICSVLKKIYDERSRSVHSGRQASWDHVVLAQQFLMAAIPRAAALEDLASRDTMAKILDDANFLIPDRLGEVRSLDWPRFVAFSTLV